MVLNLLGPLPQTQQCFFDGFVLLCELDANGVRWRMQLANLLTHI
jgi:hypothetical protein